MCHINADKKLANLELGNKLHADESADGAQLGFAGRAALTDNFDACRDLSGRRMRHVNADKKLIEWAAQARERELEKVAAKHIRDEERAAQQAAEQQVQLCSQDTAHIPHPCAVCSRLFWRGRLLAGGTCAASFTDMVQQM